MRPAASVPHLFSSPHNADDKSERLLVRRSTTTDLLYSAALVASPLHDLPPLALPGLTTRVARNNTVGASLDLIAEPFTPSRDHAHDEELLIVQGGYTLPLVASAAVAVLSALQFGFHLGCMNTASAAMRAHLGISVGAGDGADITWGLCVSIFCLGALSGCSLGASVADSVGRRSAMLLVSAVSSLGTLLQLAAAATPTCAAPPCIAGPAVCFMLAGRAVVGAAAGATTVIIPMYLGEISPPQVRGALGTCFQLVCCFGILAAQVLGLPALLGGEILWPAYLGLALAPAALQVLLQAHLLESPRWLASSMDAIEAASAQEVLARLRGADDFSSVAVLQELDAIQLEAEVRLSGLGGAGVGGRPLPILLDRKVRRGLLLCVACAVAQQFSGINNAFNYSTDFLSRGGLSADAITEITVLMNVGNVLVTLLSVLLMDSMGRRTLLLCSSGGMAVCVVGLSAALSAAADATWARPLALVSLVGFVVAFGVGMGPIPWLLPAELFPPDRCAAGAAVSATCNWLANFVVSQSFVLLSSSLSGLCFLPFAAILLCYGAYVLRYLPETRGKSLAQIAAELERADGPARGRRFR